MGKSEITVFIVLINIIILVFIAGIILFVFQYRRRKLLHEKEKAGIEKQHKLDLLNTQLQAQQETMQFIGSEIHDSVAQKLTLASIYTQKLEFENKEQGIGERLTAISTIMNDSLAELRDLSRTLTDNRIQQTGLTELLLQECERVNEAGICKAVLESDFEKEMSVTVKSFVLRVMQEFMQNSLKHSGCTLVSIKMETGDEGLSVTASDNGKGFDSGNTHSKGIGLTNMTRRIHLLGGTFNMQSEPGKGTTLRIFIPAENLISA